MFQHTFPDKAFVTHATARMLLEIEAVHFRPEEPYVLTSGLASPVYIDCRRLISYPRIRGALMDFAVATVLRDVGFERFDVIAGGETAGIAFAAWMAERLALPMVYVRKKPKGFGRDARIEGDLPAHKRVLLVEDLATDGGSKIAFAGALADAGAEIAHTFAIFYYDIFPTARQNLRKAGIELHYLATWRDILAVARDDGHFDAAVLAAVEAFLQAPLAWSKENGGVGELASPNGA